MGRWIRYFTRQTLLSIRRSPVLQLVSISTIAVSLLVLGVFLGLVLNVDQLADRWSREVRLIAFLADDLGPDALREAAETVEAWPEVVTVVPVSRVQALEIFRADLGADPALLDGVDASMMLASLEITPDLKHRTPDALDTLGERLSSVPGIGQIDGLDHGRDIIERLYKIRDVLRLGGLSLAALVALAVIFIISNTVRLGLYARRTELEIMKLVGATDRFVRAPYYIEGVLQGAGGAVLSLIGLYGIYRLVLPRVIAFEQIQIELEFLPTYAIIALIGGSALVGLLASHFSSGHFLDRVDLG